MKSISLIIFFCLINLIGISQDVPSDLLFDDLDIKRSYNFSISNENLVKSENKNSKIRLKVGGILIGTGSAIMFTSYATQPTTDTMRTLNLIGLTLMSSGGIIIAF